MLPKQMLMLVDEQDNFLGEYKDITTCHTGKGVHHRAFIVFLTNKKGEALLQKRKHVRWDNVWDISVTSHTLHLPDHDESYLEAATRALKVEMGIPEIPLKRTGEFNYYAKHGEQCENEFVAIFQGNYDGPLTPNSEVVYEYRWVNPEQFFRDMRHSPDDYTPWAKHAMATLERRERR
ncbi:MAG: NUDIX domain-containing protein [Patescibacteria group bacterium]